MGVIDEIDFYIIFEEVSDLADYIPA